MKTATLSEGDRTRSADSADLSMPAIFNNGSSSTDAIDSELLNKQVWFVCLPTRMHGEQGSLYLS